MSDETKGATVMVPGCDHDNMHASVSHGSDVGICEDCGALLCLSVWRKLHPPPEPPKSWVERTADRSIDPVAFAAFARETVEECCRVLKVDGRHGGAEFLRRAMLEPKP